MIPLLDIGALQTALATYLADYFEEGEITVRLADSGKAASFATVAPPIVRGLSSAIQAARSAMVVIICNDGPAEMPGVYGGDDFEVNLVVVTPVVIEGLGDADHTALFSALCGAFPNRGSNVEEDLEWQAVHDAIDTAIQAVTPYHLTGFYAEAGQVRKGDDRLEQAVRFVPGLMHESLVGG